MVVHAFNLSTQEAEAEAEADAGRSLSWRPALRRCTEENWREEEEVDKTYMHYTHMKFSKNE